MNDRLKALADAGVSIWLDDLSRERIETGNLADLVKDKSVVGVTTNPTIFAGGDRQRRALRRAGPRARRRRRARRRGDLRADHRGRPQRLRRARPRRRLAPADDGRVSIEVEPTLANDTEGTIASAQALWAAVDRPNVLIKIPATEEGLPAITAVIAQGISVNVTLIFSIERYREVMDAYLSRPRGRPATTASTSTASSRSRRSSSPASTPRSTSGSTAIGADEATALKGKAAVANARLAYARLRGGARPATAGSSSPRPAPTPQRPLWASTGVKNPDYPDTLYVADLVVADTVNTMPEKTMRGVRRPRRGHRRRGHRQGRRGPGGLRPARARSASTSTTCSWSLEDEGVDKFKKSWTELVETVEGQMEKAQPVTRAPWTPPPPPPGAGSARSPTGSPPTCGAGSPPTPAGSTG